MPRSMLSNSAGERSSSRLLLVSTEPQPREASFRVCPTRNRGSIFSTLHCLHPASFSGPGNTGKPHGQALSFPASGAQYRSDRHRLGVCRLGWHTEGPGKYCQDTLNFSPQRTIMLRDQRSSFLISTTLALSFPNVPATRLVLRWPELM